MVVKTCVDQVARHRVPHWHVEVHGDELGYVLEGIQKEEEGVDQTG